MLKRLTIILTILIAFCSCRVNNGDIGDYFGSWLLYDMKVDGETPDDFDPEQTFWEFQNNIIQISRVLFMYEKYGCFGTWGEKDGTLLLNFSHHDINMSYGAPNWIGMVADEIMHLTINSRESKRMTLSWTSPTGRLYVYSLRKIW